MKLHLLHGPASNASRKKLTQLKEGFDKNNVLLFESGASIEDVLGSLVTIPLISEKRLIIWENPPEDIIIDSFDSSDALTLILWFDHEVNQKKPILVDSKLKGAIFFFPEEKEASVFPLLDALGSRDIKAYLELEKRNNASFGGKTSPNDIQYILTMIFYLLRNLVVTSKNAHDFVKRKNEKMRRNFSGSELTNLYESVLEIDFKIKQGLLEIPQAKFNLVKEFLRF